ncbi:uncharacterized protein LOC120559688 [Scomber scombrus]|uniref:Gypsy retrotransposon integrase-like protein 1 n=1 Tax=Scomber scombrus TaxID=13677 RepID=A0AAV1PUC6_SCOSC
MEPEMAKQLMDVKIHDRYPEGITSKQRYVIKRRADNFIIKDGELHYICRRRKKRSEHVAKVITTAEEANSVFVEFHCSSIGGHFGVEKTQSAIISRYYWPGIQEDIRKWIAQCPECQAKRAVIKEKMEYEPIQIVNSYLANVGNSTGAAIVDAYTMTAVWQETHRHFRRLDLSKHDVAAGAVCHNRHWTLIIMYIKERRSLFVDPFGATEQQIRHCKTVTRKLSVFSDDLAQLCRACGEESSGADTDNWIECTTCGLWYHTICVHHPPEDEDYLCKACQ